MWTRLPIPIIFGRFRNILVKFYEEVTDTEEIIVDTSTT